MPRTETQLDMFASVNVEVPALATAPESLAEYDVILVNSSGGKDSLASLALVCGMAKEACALDRVVCVHADLGHVEWAGTKELAERQASHFGVRFEVVRCKDGLLDLVRRRGMFPANKQRYCTSNLKTGQVQKLITRLADEWRVAERERAGKRAKLRRPRILNVLGMRGDESPKRAKFLPFVPDDPKSSSSTRRQVDRWLPLHSWTLEDVWGAIDEWGLRPLSHYAYTLGMPRVSCVFCIFAPKSALILAGKHNPALLAEYVAVESEIGHRFRMDLSMAQVAASVAAGESCEIKDWRM